MNKLTQQLEDKRKGCKEQIEKYDLILKCGDWIPTEFDRIKVYCPICQAEIAILEQAIAEIKELEQMYKVRNDDAKDYAKVITELKTKMQKQRQDFEMILNRIIGKIEDSRNNGKMIVDYCKSIKQ